MKIAYATYKAKLSEILNLSAKVAEKCAAPEAEAVLDRLRAVERGLEVEEKVKIAFIGEFSSGKSSIISAMTGEKIHIDADVATSDIREYECDGVVLLDTPGVQADVASTDHDRISRQAVSGADLVVFVATNELFGPRLAEHFRFVADDDGLGMARKMAVVVNKMDRESNPESVIVEEISKVLGPHQSIPVFLCAASCHLQAEGRPEPLKAILLKQSRMGELTKGIDEFVEKSGKLGRMATPLQEISDALDSLEPLLADDEDGKKQLELIRRWKIVLSRVSRQLDDVADNARRQVRSLYMERANEAAKQLSEISEPEDVELLYQSGLKNANSEVESLCGRIEADIREAVFEALEEMEAIENSPLARQVEKFQVSRPGKTTVDLCGKAPKSGTLGARIAREVASPFQKGLEKAAANPEKLRDAVYVVGKKLGKNFRPYEAVNTGRKLAGIAGKGAKVLPFVAPLIDLYGQYREEEGKEKKARHLANLRMALRNAFADQADLEGKAMAAAVSGFSRDAVFQDLRRAGDMAEAIASKKESNRELTCEISRIRRRIEDLKCRLYAEEV